MVLYGFLKISNPVISDAKITVRSSLSCPVSHFFRNFEVSFMILYSLLEISKTVIGVAKITERFSFSCFVSHFFRNLEMLFMVLYGFLKISNTVVGVTKSTVYVFFYYPVSYFSDNFEVYFKDFYGGLEIFIVDIGVYYFLAFLRHFNENVQISLLRLVEKFLLDLGHTFLFAWVFQVSLKIKYKYFVVSFCGFCSFSQTSMVTYDKVR